MPTTTSIDWDRVAKSVANAEGAVVNIANVGTTLPQMGVWVGDRLPVFVRAEEMYRARPGECDATDAITDLVLRKVRENPNPYPLPNKRP